MNYHDFIDEVRSTMVDIGLPEPDRVLREIFLVPKDGKKDWWEFPGFLVHAYDDKNVYQGAGKWILAMMTIEELLSLSGNKLLILVLDLARRFDMLKVTAPGKDKIAIVTRLHASVEKLAETIDLNMFSFAKMLFHVGEEDKERVFDVIVDDLNARIKQLGETFNTKGPYARIESPDQMIECNNLRNQVRDISDGDLCMNIVTSYEGLLVLASYAQTLFSLAEWERLDRGGRAAYLRAVISVRMLDGILDTRELITISPPFRYLLAQSEYIKGSA